MRPASLALFLPDILSVERYKLPRVKSVEIVDRLRSSPMRFWKNMVNFATWCATTGCGVCVEDHLNSEIPMMRSFYRFRVYYQICRILEEIQAPLPQDDAWDAFDAPHRAYDRICSEFGILLHASTGHKQLAKTMALERRITGGRAGFELSKK